MKTLADLKRQAADFTWEMTFNSWSGGQLKEGHKLFGKQRKVIRVQTNGLWFESETAKSGSWLDFPKANELHIEDRVFAGHVERPESCGEFYVKIIPKDSKGCMLGYHLRPIKSEA